MLLLLSALTLIIIFIYYVNNLYTNSQYFKQRGIAYQPSWTSMKRFSALIFGKINFMDLVRKIYEDFPNERFVGIWQFGVPTLYIRDPSLIKQLTIKDFDYFTDHRGLITPSSDELFFKNLFSMKGQRWRDMRATLSPAFTSSKMRNMYVFMEECAKSFAQTFADKNEDLIHVEMRDIVTKYTSDVIASASFGIKCDSLGDPENEFYRMGKALTEPSKTQQMKILFLALFPKIAQYFNISFFPKEVYAFFKRIVCESMKTREEKHIIRPDMIHLLMKARKGRLHHETVDEESDTGFATAEESSIGKNGKLTEITDDDITAQALIFFIAGFDTTSSTMSFMALELCRNPDVQGKLHEEIEEVLANAEGGNVTYEEILKMKYLDQVLSETLRKWSPGLLSDRLCVRDYVIEPVEPEQKPCVLRKGDVIAIPTIGLHYDPKYYTNPDTFDPDRFSDENKKNIATGTYIPFGIGPRNCIGSRFALLEIKVFFFHLLTKFEMVFTEKTVLPLQLVTVGITVRPKGGFQLGLKRWKGVH